MKNVVFYIILCVILIAVIICICHKMRCLANLQNYHKFLLAIFYELSFYKCHSHHMHVESATYRPNYLSRKPTRIIPHWKRSYQDHLCTYLPLPSLALVVHLSSHSKDSTAFPSDVNFGSVICCSVIWILSWSIYINIFFTLHRHH